MKPEPKWLITAPKIIQISYLLNDCSCLVDVGATHDLFINCMLLIDVLYYLCVQDLGVDTQVAQHLAATYGDRAFSVGKGGGRQSTVISCKSS